MSYFVRVQCVDPDYSLRYLVLICRKASSAVQYKFLPDVWINIALRCAVCGADIPFVLTKETLLIIPSCCNK